MRIISGKARGTNLYTLPGKTTRPTLDRVKESVFNIIQNDIKNSVFLDLFSGSGAIGLEAASRGAKKVVLCDSSKQAISIIKKNIEKTHLEDSVVVYSSDFQECLKKLTKEKFDLIYLDPPYKTDFVIKSIDLILKLDLVNENSVIIVETDDETTINKLENLKMKITGKKKYGRAYVVFLKKQSVF